MRIIPTFKVRKKPKIEWPDAQHKEFLKKQKVHDRVMTISISLMATFIIIIAIVAMHTDK